VYQRQTLYIDSYYRGHALNLDSGYYDRHYLASRGFSDAISSVKVTPGYFFVGCPHDGLTGHCVHYTTDQQYVASSNNQISSIAIYKK